LKRKRKKMYKTKQFNFGARGGEVIGGGLARDLEGKFISKEELGSAIRQRLLDRLRQKKGIGEFGEATNREAVAGELGARLPAGALSGLATLGNGEPLTGDIANRLVDAGLARVDNTGQTRLSGAGASLLIAANRGNVERAQDALIRAQTQIGKGRAGGGGGGREEETEEDREAEKEQEEADNREQIANKLKGGANEVSQEQIEGMNEVRLGNDIAPETAKQLADKGMLEFDDAGTPFLSFDGRVFINAANQGELSLVRDVLARSAAKFKRKIERMDRLETNIVDNQAKIDELQEQIKTFEGARTIADITEKAQLQNRLNELQDRVAKDTEEVGVLRVRTGRETAELAEEQVEEIEIASEKSFDERMDEFLGAKGGEEDFQLSVRAAFRQIWAGIIDNPFDFVDEMVGVINRGLTRAWHEGAKEQGISSDDLTEKELNALSDTINAQFVYLPGLARDLIEIREMAIKDGITPTLRNMPDRMFSRASLWVNRYQQTKILASTMAALDSPKMWVLGDAEHCPSCKKLEGKVKRGSFWLSSGIMPQTPGASYLDCEGYNCACSLEDTKQSISRGALPNLP
jgi:hypothetical protein